jgi:hypothetical protein
MTARPNVAAWRTPSGRRSASRRTPRDPRPTERRPRTASSGITAATASTSPVAYGARQLVASVSGGTITSASPPPAIVAPPYRPCAIGPRARGRAR